MVTALDQGGMNDIIISDGDFSFVSGVEAYAIIIRDAVRTIYGELQYDTETGVPYFATVFENPSFIGKWKSDVTTTVSSFPFVTGISEFIVDFNPYSHILSYTLKIETDGGIAVVQE